MRRTLLSLTLILCLLSGLVLPTFAARSPATKSPTYYTTSQAGLAFIGELTGASVTAVKEAETAVNTFIRKYSVSLSQQQFDALVDFLLEKGTNMLSSGYRVEKLIASGSYTDAELADAFCAWVKVNGSFSQKALGHRLRQIKLFLYGSYTGNCEANFRYVYFDAKGGVLSDQTVMCFSLGQAYGTLPVASLGGKHFAGWFNGSDFHLCNTTVVTANQQVTARWSDAPMIDPNEETAHLPTPAPDPDPKPDPKPDPNPSVNPTYPDQWPTLPALKVSEDCVEFIKKNEGFVEYPIWDYGQYSVGYGSRYDNAPIPLSSPITEEEADYLLRYYLSSFETVVDRIFAKGTVQHTQSQYDAVVSLTYNLGQQWIDSEYLIYQYILYGGCTEMDFVNAMGSWCNAGGGVLIGLCGRRMEEADMYLNGDYALKNAPYRCLIFNASPGKSADTVEYYKAGEPLGWLPGAVRSGYHLEGWYSRSSGGDLYTVNTPAPADVSERVRMVYAHWAEGDPIEEVFVPTPDQYFSDVPKNTWYYSWVKDAVDQKLFSGMTATTFEPDSPMTRAMLVTVLYRMAGSPAISVPTPFADVPSGQWYSAPVQWAYTTGIVNGMSQNEFGLNLSITREQLTTMLFRYGKHAQMDTSARTNLRIFGDASAVSDYALDAMQWAVASGIVNGIDGSLQPQGRATRAQCAKMVVAFLQ